MGNLMNKQDENYYSRSYVFEKTGIPVSEHPNWHIMRRPLSYEYTDIERDKIVDDLKLAEITRKYNITEVCNAYELDKCLPKSYPILKKLYDEKMAFVVVYTLDAIIYCNEYDLDKINARFARLYIIVPEEIKKQVCDRIAEEQREMDRIRMQEEYKQKQQARRAIEEMKKLAEEARREREKPDTEKISNLLGLNLVDEGLENDNIAEINAETNAEDAAGEVVDDIVEGAPN